MSTSHSYTRLGIDSSWLMRHRDSGRAYLSKISLFLSLRRRLVFNGQQEGSDRVFAAYITHLVMSLGLFFTGRISLHQSLQIATVAVRF